tara:strand:+ start:705 stop:875 length:171 start_codon:yes stop_codon:yes gene_type:complete
MKSRLRKPSGKTLVLAFQPGSLNYSIIIAWLNQKDQRWDMNALDYDEICFSTLAKR